MQSKNISILHKGSQKKIWDYLSQIQRRSNCIIAGFARFRLGWRKHLYMVQFAGDQEAINKLVVLMGGVVPNAQAQAGAQPSQQPTPNRKARRTAAKKAPKRQAKK